MSQRNGRGRKTLGAHGKDILREPYTHRYTDHRGEEVTLTFTPYTEEDYRNGRVSGSIGSLPKPIAPTTPTSSLTREREEPEREGDS